jgi:hypothetical protein
MFLLVLTSAFVGGFLGYWVGASRRLVGATVGALTTTLLGLQSASIPWSAAADAGLAVALLVGVGMGYAACKFLDG